LEYLKKELKMDELSIGKEIDEQAENLTKWLKETKKADNSAPFHAFYGTMDKEDGEYLVELNVQTGEDKIKVFADGMKIPLTASEPEGHLIYSTHFGSFSRKVCLTYLSLTRSFTVFFSLPFLKCRVNLCSSRGLCRLLFYPLSDLKKTLEVKKTNRLKRGKRNQPAKAHLRTSDDIVIYVN
jgi:predicted P-loop ATPase/GTPase